MLGFMIVCVFFATSRDRRDRLLILLLNATSQRFPFSKRTGGMASCLCCLPLRQIFGLFEEFSFRAVPQLSVGAGGVAAPHLSHVSFVSRLRDLRRLSQSGRMPSVILQVTVLAGFLLSGLKAVSGTFVNLIHAGTPLIFVFKQTKDKYSRY